MCFIVLFLSRSFYFLFFLSGKCSYCLSAFLPFLPCLLHSLFLSFLKVGRGGGGVVLFFVSWSHLPSFLFLLSLFSLYLSLFSPNFLSFLRSFETICEFLMEETWGSAPTALPGSPARRCGSLQGMMHAADELSFFDRWLFSLIDFYWQSYCTYTGLLSVSKRMFRLKKNTSTSFNLHAPMPARQPVTYDSLGYRVVVTRSFFTNFFGDSNCEITKLTPGMSSSLFRDTTPPPFILSLQPPPLSYSTHHTAIQ